MVSRRLTFKARRASDAVRFIDTYLGRVKAREVYIKYRGGRVEVKVWANPALAKLSAVEARKVYGTLRQGGRVNTYDLTVVLQEAKPKSPIPPDTIELALRLMGHRAELNGSRLRTDAGFDRVVEVARRLSEAYHEMVDLDVSSNAKRLIAPLAVARGMSIYDAMDELVGMGLLSRGRVNDREYVTLTVNVDEAVKALTAGKTNQST